MGEGLVALPGFEVVGASSCGEGDFRECAGEEERALAVAVLLDAQGPVVGLAHVDAAGIVLEGVDARGGPGLLGCWCSVVGEAASWQPGAVGARLGVARADKVALPAAAEADAPGGLGGLGGLWRGWDVLVGRRVVEVVLGLEGWAVWG